MCMLLMGGEAAVAETDWLALGIWQGTPGV